MTTPRSAAPAAAWARYVAAVAQYRAAERRLRPLGTEVVQAAADCDETAAATKTDMAREAGIFRQNLDRWLASIGAASAVESSKK